MRREHCRRLHGCRIRIRPCLSPLLPLPFLLLLPSYPQSIDVLFNMASVGVTRWNFHGGPGGAYTWVTYANTSQDQPVVKPLFYGIW